MKKIVVVLFMTLLITNPIYSAGGNPRISGSSSYEIEVVIEAPWGNDKGEFGYLAVNAPGEIPKGAVPSKVLIGPTCFTVSYSGNIYVLDLVNRRIQIFDKKGKFKEIINLELPEDVIVDNYSFQEMHVDSSGNIYAKYTINIGGWFIFNNQGQLVKRIIDRKEATDRLKRVRLYKEKIEKGEDEIYEIYHPDKKDNAIKELNERIASLEVIYRNSALIDFDENDDKEIRIDKDKNYYLGKSHKITSGVIQKVNKITKEISVIKDQKMKLKDMDLATIRINDESINIVGSMSGDEYISDDKTVHKLVRSSDPNEMHPVKIIRWKRR